MKSTRETRWQDLPIVTLGVMVSWILVSLTVLLGYSSRLGEASESYYSAANLAIREPIVDVKGPYLDLVRAVVPEFENDNMLEFMRKKSTPSDGYTPQTTFEETADHGIAALRGHPFRTLGLVPSESPTYQFISHTWVHAGLIHLVATALLLLLVAPTLEALWGRALFGATIAIVPLMTAGLFYLVSQNGD
jgi:hypothetical protein